VPYASEGEGLHLPPVPEALNRAACPDVKYPAQLPEVCSAFAVFRCCVTCLVRIQLKHANFLHTVRVASARAGCRQVIDVYGYCSREPLQAGKQERVAQIMIVFDWLRVTCVPDFTFRHSQAGTLLCLDDER